MTALLAEVRAALEGFLDVIDRADLVALAPCWCPDGTMYFPFKNTADLVEGRPAVLERFGRMFHELRARNPGPRYIGFEIRSLAAHALDREHVLVTTALAFQGQIGRRTIVFRREAEGLRILHLHASNFGSGRGAPAG